MEIPLKIDIDLASKAINAICIQEGVKPLELPKFDKVSEDIDQLASAALDAKYTLAVLCSCRNLVLEIVARWISNYPNRVDIPILARCIDIFPEISPLIQHVMQNYDITITEQLLLAYYRLLQHDLNAFRPYINTVKVSRALENSNSRPIKYLCLRVLALHQRLVFSDSWLLEHIGTITDIMGDYDGICQDLCILDFLEAKRISYEVSLLQTYGSVDQKTQSVRQLSSFKCHQSLTNIGGILIPKLYRDIESVEDHSISHFITTSSSSTSLREFAQYLQLGKPILLSGPEGCGKTLFIDEAAKRLGSYNSMVKIHLGDQTDAKTLIGTYSTGSTPGSFEWRPGTLTLAVQQGRWVVVEDIDKAPTEIVSVLLPLLEKKQLLIPSRSETIMAKNGFQIISTVTTSANSRTEEIIGHRLWKIIDIPQHSSNDLRDILRLRFPRMEKLSTQLVYTYEQVKQQYNSSPFMKSGQTRLISSRDLIKWISRCDQMLQMRGITNTLEFPSSIYDDFFAEAVDCFASFIPFQHGRDSIAKTIGDCLDIAPSRVQLYLSKHVPLLNESDSDLQVGRSVVKKRHALFGPTPQQLTSRSRFALTNHSLRLMEGVSKAISMREPLLLVGETGTGKTTVVQYLATCLNKNLKTINLSQQTELSDLLGGFKPVDGIQIALPLKEEFDSLFEITFSSKKNAKFYHILNEAVSHGKWRKAVKLWKEAYNTATEFLRKDEPIKKKRRLDPSARQAVMQDWNRFLSDVEKFEVQVKKLDNSFIFSFVDGILVQALRNGDWVLLDEINLASADTLESISELLVEKPSITISEKGDSDSIKAHPDFRFFACMNPATDIGKKDLPPGIRSRFTEIYVESPDNDISDLLAIIDKYIGNFIMNDQWIGNDLAELYLEAKKLAYENKLVDGANQTPHFSIRTLSRTLSYASSLAPVYGLRRASYEGFCMCFLTLLNQESEHILHPIILRHTVGRLPNPRSVLSQIPKVPDDGSQYVQFKHYWLRQGTTAPIEHPESYIITSSVEKNLLNLARASAIQKFPVLIQGPTSSGKTSLINYLAKRTGHKFVRINNHEHTDLQEYLGGYASDEKGILQYQEGILVDAVRNGHWIVLDELNLAPTDVLEALNRLLDDNRELLIPETHEIVKPHSEFMLFATQNPPGLYGGRKLLSRAFRNRFLELHFDDIPEDELEVILRERCSIAPSYAKKIVEVYRQLSIQRQYTRALEQKNSFATLRDLFRWALRDAVGYEELALHGYMLLAERVRLQEERSIVKNTIEKVMKVQLDIDAAYDQLVPHSVIKQKSDIVWTKGMLRLLILVNESIKRNEPVLLVGETGCGKTTICQILSETMNKVLYTVNAHQNMETGDIIGAQRPVRSRSQTQALIATEIHSLLKSIGKDKNISMDVDDLIQVYHSLEKKDLDDVLVSKIDALIDRLKVLFEWKDGSLVEALKSGNHFLLDEISLADDSVLERLNSVLESERLLLLSEKGTDNINIEATSGFQFFATMNPGGDYGKKELSPALRNRFTEIWVPSMEDFNDVLQIAQSKLLPKLHNFAPVIVNFGKWFGERYGGGNASSGVISLRDILSWIDFVNILSVKLDGMLSLFHGACMVFIDSVGTNSLASLAEDREILSKHRLKCVDKLGKLLQFDFRSYYLKPIEICFDNTKFSLGVFELDRENSNFALPSISFDAPTTALNTFRIVRAMHSGRPILLEGSPGVGKTSLITAIAGIVGANLTRINLSEQTDLIDLFGSDAPAEGKSAGEFVWRDAPFLRAMQNGDWVLLDEMNLASQSVLEGLNACLDHRSETFIPELDKVFKCHSQFRVFAAQNPQHQGGGRKGLPKSFLNRFAIVYIDVFEMADLEIISSHNFPDVENSEITALVKYVSDLDDHVSRRKVFGGLGSPFEFNLRDTMRWLSVYSKQKLLATNCTLHDYFDLIIGNRFRTENDKSHAKDLFASYFGEFPSRIPFFNLGSDFLQAGHSIIPRESLVDIGFSNYSFLQCNSKVLEAMISCVLNSLPIILVGPSNSGKTAIVRYLAKTVGVELEEFAMNSDIDSTDLLGGFDQIDISNKSSEVRSTIGDLAAQMSRKFFISGEGSNELNLEICRLASAVPNLSNLKQLRDCLEQIISNKYPFWEVAQRSISNLESLLEEFTHDSSARFQWFDGVLLRAVQNGHWIVLDNANLCNPSVLDRLNSLLEPDGCLLVNECSQSDGTPRIVRPHPHFRLFLTIDPKYGELSRAMRNRGVEIFLESLDVRTTNFDKQILGTEILNTEMTIEEAVDRISLNKDESQLVTRYLKSNNSWPQILSLLADATMLAGNIDEFLLQSLCLHVQGIQSIAHSLTNISSLSSFKSTSNFWSSLVSTTLILRPIIEPHLNYLYESAASNGCLNQVSSNIWLCQPNNPLLNQYFTELAGKNWKLFSDGIIYLINLIPIVAQTLTKLNEQKRLAGTKKPAKLTYLEQCVIGKIKTEKSIIKADIGNILASYCNFFDRFFDNCSKDLPTDKCIFTAVSILQNIFSYVIEYSDTIDPDQSKLKVLSDILNEWSNDYQKYFSNEYQLFKDIETLSNPQKMTRGFSMELLWRSFRYRYPISIGLWECYGKLYTLLNQLDLISSYMLEKDQKAIANLKLSILHLISEVSSSNSDTHASYSELIDKLELKVKDLEQENDLVPDRKVNLFTRGFQSLLALMELDSINQWSIEKCIEMVSYAEVSSFRLLPYISNDIKFPSPLYELLMTSDTADVTILEKILDNDLALQLPLYLSDLRNVKARNIVQVTSDLRLFGRKIVENFSSINLDSLCQLANTLKEHLQIIESLHFDIDTRITSFYEHIKKQYLQTAANEISGFYDSKSLGKAYIWFSIGLIYLYVPNIPFDPAIREHVELDLNDKQIQESNKRDSAWGVLKTCFLGYADSISGIIGSGSRVEKNSSVSTYRPHHSQFNSISRDWNLLIESYVGHDIIMRLLNGSSEEIISWQRNITQYILRMRSNFSKYQDITKILEGYLYSLKLGFTLLNWEESRSPSLKWIMDPSKFALPNTSTSILPILANETLDEASLIQLSEYIVLGRDHTQFRENKNFQFILQKLFSNWSIEQKKRQIEEAANASIYVPIDNDLEREFHELFPEYTETATSVKSEESDFDFRLVQLYILYFGNTEKDEPLWVVMERGLSSAHKFNADNAIFQTGISNLCTLQEEQLNEPNFYKQGNLGELLKATNLISDIEVSIVELLNRWPENELLLNIQQACNEFLDYPITIPVARMLQKVEQILIFINQWEKYASNEVSLSVLLNKIIHLIISWRKLELSTWKNLFAEEEKAVMKSMTQWWFYLYENLIDIPLKCLDMNSEIDLSSITRTIALFLSESPQGQFRSRLSLLGCFLRDCETRSLNKMRDTIGNVISYYKQYEYQVESVLDHSRKKYVKEIQEIILLTSWKDVNVDALRESARKSHYKLYKVVRQYRDILNYKVTSIVESSLPSYEGNSATEDPPIILSNAVQNLPISESLVGEIFWKNRPARLRNIITTTSSLHKHIQGFAEVKLFFLADLAKSITDHAQKLQKETPQELTDENKKLIASLKVEKAKLFSGTLKQLRDAGFKYTPKTEIVKQQAQISNILASSYFIHSNEKPIGEKYFFLILEMIPKLRIDVATGNEDIPQSDLQRGMGVAENIISLVLSLRNTLGYGTSGKVQLEKAMNAFRAICEMPNLGNRICCENDIVDQFEYCQHIMNWLPKLIDSALHTEECVSRLMRREPFDSSKFEDMKVSVCNISTILLNQRDLAQYGISTLNWKTSFHSIRSELSQFTDFIGNLIESSRESAVSLNLLHSWLSSVLQFTWDPLESNVSEIQNLNNVICKLCDSILVVVQNIKSFNFADQSEDSNWYSKSISSLVKVQNALYLDKIIGNIEEILSSVRNCESTLTGHLFRSALPILQEYMILVEVTDKKLREMYCDCSLSAYKLLKVFSTIAKVGFCGPQDQKNEADSEATKQGTGLGDGEGAQDHSKDIEPDEDMSELAQQENNDSNDNKEDDNEHQDDAVDIEGDMASGALEDVSDHDDDENNEEQQEQDLDEEIGNIDDLDPNAVDEKLWDEPAENDLKEKESDRPSGNADENFTGNDQEDGRNEESDKQTKEEQGKDEKEGGEEEEEEEEEEDNIGEQEDEVGQKDGEELEDYAQDTEKLELPEDLNLENDDLEEQENGNDDLNDMDEFDNDEEDKDTGNEDIKNDDVNNDMINEDSESNLDNMQDIDNVERENMIESEGEEDEEGNISQENHDKDETEEEEVDGNDNEVSDNDESNKKEENNGNVNADQMDIDTEGLGGVEDAREPADGQDSTKTELNTEKESKGDDEATSKEEEQIGGQGELEGSAENKDDGPKNEEEQKTNESVKQLGDILKEFYKRRNEILEASRDNETPDLANEKMDEFEHVDGADNKFDTQALGNATKDEHQTIDDSMAIDEEDEEVKKDLEPDESSITVDEKNENIINEEPEDIDIKGEQFDRPQGLSSIGKAQNSNDEWVASNGTEQGTNSVEYEDDGLIDTTKLGDLLPPRSAEEAASLWKKYDVSTQELALTLCEQLRLVLEPTLATKLRGDFKTGKRLNMKRIIPYIASQFKKDKIWMRRVKPSKRQYQILIAVDDSQSMSESRSVDLAFQTIALVSKALTQLEAGDLGIMRFGELAQLVHPFDKPFTGNSGSQALQWFGFNQDKTDVEKLLFKSLKILENAQRLSRQDIWQLEIVISDGICENHERLRQLVRKAHEERIMMVFVVIDGLNKEGSILDMGQVSYTTDEEGNMNLNMTKYLDTFPFEYYVIVRDIRELPSILSMLLRQYFSQITSD